MTVKSARTVTAMAILMVGAAGCSNVGDTESSAPPAPSTERSAVSPEEAAGAPYPGSPEPAGGGSGGKPVVVKIKNFEYDGPKKVAAGAMIKVQNNDRSTHSLTAEGGEFAELILEGGGASGTFTAPLEAGKYDFVCKFHPEMVDTLVVR